MKNVALQFNKGRHPLGGEHRSVYSEGLPARGEVEPHRTPPRLPASGHPIAGRRIRLIQLLRGTGATLALVLSARAPGPKILHVDNGQLIDVAERSAALTA